MCSACRTEALLRAITQTMNALESEHKRYFNPTTTDKWSYISGIEFSLRTLLNAINESGLA